MKRLFFFLLLPAVACAEPRTSANCTIAPEALDSGGRRTASARCTHDGSLGMVAGFSSATLPDRMARHGFVGQLHDTTALRISANPPEIDESGTRQLEAAKVFDDDSTFPVAGNLVDWAVLTGPITSISTTGLVGTAIVYEHTPATVQGTHSGWSGTLELTVLNVNPDDFGSYAGDLIDDDWQVAHFGLDNPLAAPGANPDGDPHDNWFEFHASLDPRDPTSRFHLVLEMSSAHPDGVDLVFWPVFSGRTYRVMRSPDLTAASWAPLVSVPMTQADGVRRVTDTAPPASRTFYRVEVRKD